MVSTVCNISSVLLFIFFFLQTTNVIAVGVRGLHGLLFSVACLKSSCIKVTVALHVVPWVPQFQLVHGRCTSVHQIHQRGYEKWQVSLLRL